MCFIVLNAYFQNVGHYVRYIRKTINWIRKNKMRLKKKWIVSETISMQNRNRVVFRIFFPSAVNFQSEKYNAGPPHAAAVQTIPHRCDYQAAANFSNFSLDDTIRALTAQSYVRSRPKSAHMACNNISRFRFPSSFRNFPIPLNNQTQRSGNVYFYCIVAICLSPFLYLARSVCAVYYVTGLIFYQRTTSDRTYFAGWYSR